mgnify:FL=1
MFDTITNGLLNDNADLVACIDQLSSLIYEISFQVSGHVRIMPEHTVHIVHGYFGYIQTRSSMLRRRLPDVEMTTVQNVLGPTTR